MKYKICSIAAALLIAASLNGQTKVQNGRNYFVKNGEWYQNYNGEDYRVNPAIITVKFKSEIDSTLLADFNDKYGVEIIRKNSLGYIDLRIKPDSISLDIVDVYINSGMVESAEVNTYGSFSGDPNDAKFDQQWHHKDPEDNDIDTPEAWDIETGSPNVIVGIIDCGTEILHEDLVGNIWVNPGEDIDGDGVVWDTDDLNGIDDDGNELIDDIVGWDFFNNNNIVTNASFSHGTKTAGLVSASTNNNIGVAGVAGGWGSSVPGTKLMVTSICYWDGFQWVNDNSVLDDAILYSVEKGAHILSMSVDTSPTTAVDSALQAAYETYGAFLVASSGNADKPEIIYPASNEYVFAVGATDTADLKAKKSRYGDGLDVVAPGEDIMSTINDDGYGFESGTSFASPIVAGIAALLLSDDPSLTNQQIEEIISRSAEKVQSGIYDYDTPKEHGGWNNEMGYGRVNAFIAVAPPPPPEYLNIDNNGNNNPRLTWGYIHPEMPWDVKDFRIKRNSSFIATVPRIGNEDVFIYDDLQVIMGIGQNITYRVYTRDYSNKLSTPVSETTRGLFIDKRASLSITPHSLTLSQNFPNPFNPTTEIEFSLPNDSYISLGIYDINGYIVKTLVSRNLEAGFYKFVWDGRNNTGNLVSTGIYIYKLHAGSQSIVKKLLFVK